MPFHPMLSRPLRFAVRRLLLANPLRALTGAVASDSGPNAVPSVSRMSACSAMSRTAENDRYVDFAPATRCWALTATACREVDLAGRRLYYYETLPAKWDWSLSTAVAKWNGSGARIWLVRMTIPPQGPPEHQLRQRRRGGRHGDRLCTGTNALVRLNPPYTRGGRQQRLQPGRGDGDLRPRARPRARDSSTPWHRCSLMCTVSMIDAGACARAGSHPG